VFGWYNEVDTNEKEAMVAYVIALLWNLPVWARNNTKDFVYNTW
jgi:hypothetical protein